MKQKISLLDKSVKKLLIYSIIFFLVILIFGITLVKNNYDDEIINLEKEYKAQIDLSSNKYIQTELSNMQRYLKLEYQYFDTSADELIDAMFNFIIGFYYSFKNNSKAINFITNSAMYPLEVQILNKNNITDTRYARYLKLNDNEYLRFNLSKRKYLSARKKVALENIKNLHNNAISTLSVYALPDDFKFESDKNWYCINNQEIYSCYNKDWWIGLKFKIKKESLDTALIKAKAKKYVSFITQITYLFCITFIGIIFLYIYLLRKKREIQNQIQLTSQYFDIALNKQINLFDRQKNINTDFVYSEFRNLIYALLRFIRKINIKDSDIKKQAYIDNITGLMNMVSVNESLKLYKQKEGKSLLFCFFNIENFRIYNSMYGRNFGDQILKIVGYRIYATLKNITIGDEEHIEAINNQKYERYHFNQNLNNFECLARVSADEFLLILEINDKDNAEKIAKEYQQKITRRSVKVESFDDLITYESFKVNIFVGYSIFPLDSSNILECIGNADLAIGNEKASGNKLVFGYTKEIGYQNDANLQLQQDIRKGITNKEFLLYYQPKVDCKSGKIVGAEALVRWARGNEIIMPDKFIGLCEKSNLIITLGNEIIKMACDAQRRWIKQGLKLKLSINLSTKQLLNEGIIQIIEHNIKGIDPSLIEFEITESFSIENSTSKNIIDKIKKLKVGLSMDDFGKGYSSLSYLNDSELDFDVVKIDKSFIQNLDTNEKNKKLVEFIIKLVKSLKKKSIAEGVENIEILNFLKLLGCDEYQGFYFSKPVPEKDLLEKVFNNGNN